MIDKANLTFLPIKHDDMFVVCDLVHLEAPNAHSYICPLDHNFLNPFSDLELMLLYKNTTGEQGGRVGNAMRNILFELANRIPVREVNKIELSMQAQYIPVKGGTRYLYQKGSTKPLEKESLFKLTPVKLTKAPNELETANSPRVGPVGAVKPPSATPAPPSTTQAHSAPHSLGENLKKGSVKETIWTIADEFWNKQNRPTDKTMVLQLRRKIMEELEVNFGIKKTTSSNELGNWAKARVP